MIREYRRLVESLRVKGWRVDVRTKPKPLPQEVRSRYSWLPADIRQFLEELKATVSPDEKAWFSTVSGDIEAAFAWNQWELDSLDAAEDDAELQSQIRSFWDQHFPILMSVKSGYAYFAIGRESSIVRGEEPEYEEVIEMADSFSEFLRMVASNDPRLSRWI